MKHHHHLTRALALISLLAAAPAALAQTPALVPYQGRVQTGTPPADFTGIGQFKFALMQGTTATRLWNNNGALTADPAATVSVLVTNGLYSVMLGDASLANMAAIPPSVFANPDVRLRVWFNGTQLSPDQRLAPNGYLASTVPSLNLRGGALSFENPTDPVPYVGFDYDTASDALRLRSNIGDSFLNTTLLTVQRETGNVGVLGALGFENPTDRVPYVGFDYDTASDALRLRSNIGDSFLNTTLLTVQRTTGNVGIGTSSPTGLLTLSSDTRDSERLRLAGQEWFEADKNSVEGISFLLGVNRDGVNQGPGLRQLWIADSSRLERNATNPVVRIILGNGTNAAVIDSIATDGVTALPLLFNPNGGNIGIGTAAPTTKLHIKESAVSGSTLLLQGGDSENSFTPTRSGLAFAYHDTGVAKHFITTNHSSSPANNRMSFWLNNNPTPSVDDTPGNGTTRVMTLAGTGNVGIGTYIPNKGKLHIVGSVSATPNAGRYMSSGSTGLPTNDGSSKPTSVYADNWFGSGSGYYTDSDARIKQPRCVSNSGADLSVLRSLEVTDYQFKDRIGNGGGVQKKVIAQQVEKVFPLAVSKSTGVVPDIFCRARITDGWITLDTDVHTGERIRLITGDETAAIYDIAEVKAGAFRTTPVPPGDSVFVYGREVNDFRSVDYDAISMLNVSATQELARQLDAEKAAIHALQKANTTLEAENTALKAALAENASKDRAQDQKLAALAKLLEDLAPSAAVTTVSTRR